jgi:hypothetical protein
MIINVPQGVLPLPFMDGRVATIAEIKPVIIPVVRIMIRSDKRDFLILLIENPVADNSANSRFLRL